MFISNSPIIITSLITERFVKEYYNQQKKEANANVYKSYSKYTKLVKSLNAFPGKLAIVFLGYIQFFLIQFVISIAN